MLETNEKHADFRFFFASTTRILAQISTELMIISSSWRRTRNFPTLSTSRLPPRIDLPVDRFQPNFQTSSKNRSPCRPLSSWKTSFPPVDIGIAISTTPIRKNDKIQSVRVPWSFQTQRQIAGNERTPPSRSRSPSVTLTPSSWRSCTGWTPSRSRPPPGGREISTNDSERRAYETTGTTTTPLVVASLSTCRPLVVSQHRLLSTCRQHHLLSANT